MALVGAECSQVSLCSRERDKGRKEVKEREEEQGRKREVTYRLMTEEKFIFLEDRRNKNISR